MSAVHAKDFTDETGRLYIIYTVEQVIENMRCARATAVKMLKQLDDIGLIEKKRQGQGKPSIIYVKDFASVDFKKFNIYTSRSLKSELLEVQILNPSYNDPSQHKLSYTNSSLRQTAAEDDGDDGDETDDNDTEIGEINFISYESYETEIKEKIDFDLLSVKYDSDLVQELVNCMLDVICTKEKTVKIGKEKKDRELVKSVYLRLNYEDIVHVLERYESVRHKITYLHSYLKTMLYTVKQEHNLYYTNAVRADGVVW